jgi:hypothetical protein
VSGAERAARMRQLSCSLPTKMLCIRACVCGASKRSFGSAHAASDATTARQTQSEAGWDVRGAAQTET